MADADQAPNQVFRASYVALANSWFTMANCLERELGDHVLEALNEALNNGKGSRASGR